MRWPGRGREEQLPEEIAGQVALPSGDRLLAWSRDAASGAYLVASLYALHHVPVAAGDDPVAAIRRGEPWSRPWRDIAAGAWDPGTKTLTVTWSDGARPVMWTLADDSVRLPAVLHDRVRSSVYVMAPVRMGESDLGRVALRRDFEKGTLVEQVTLKRGRASQDPEVAEYAQLLLRDLREQAGLPVAE
ncbi:hypothetical protein [Austwickia chelonae]|uniref:hypothetical protein n=1 Tax=Austwickia chelonae TaxID=100225 RepID=UPI000E24469D|nr:hypothetical protein [Austwickia chelonae]